MGKTSSAVKRKWNSAHYDRIFVLVRKGEKEKIKEDARLEGKSLNEYILEAIREKRGG